ncbi:hypothetical protein C1I97_27190 [Streptomyces sp. NTH33]|uniref:Rv1733c family protein n=1 Tax=Streptomyces sp. NTH33 TaxID=1735453 RepID=UPI000DA88F56|nr:hypothetical protein [Streptomyces sp. NTH33]PZG95259.1 hypothetical protein C1I97_27190 [Streptomyces sp. NTH33]
MSGGKRKGRVRRRLWRWRGNPLRRREDVVEAWIVLAMWVVIVVGGAVAGTVVARVTDQDFARQRADRQPVRAVLLTDTPPTAPADSDRHRPMAEVRWTAPDGTARIGLTPVDGGLRSGATVTVWQDGHGVLVPRPAAPAEGRVEAALFGTAAALALACLSYVTTTAVRRRLDQRRYDQWAAEWELVGPLWDQKTS